MEDPIAAHEELERLARAGDATAQFQLAIRYTHGDGMRADYKQAVRWFHAAADQGHPGAQDSLGVRYATGQGVPINLAEAAKWYRRAAEQGRANAQYNLARMSATGQGMAQNIPDTADVLPRDIGVLALDLGRPQGRR